MEHVKQQASSKRRLKLGDIAEHLQVKKFVVRAWEKELGLAPQGGLYGAEAIELFKKIKQLVLIEHKSIAHVRDVIGAAKVESSVEAEPQSVTGASVCETEYHAAMMQEEASAAVEEAVCIEAAPTQVCDDSMQCAAEAVVAQAPVIELAAAPAAPVVVAPVAAETGQHVPEVASHTVVAAQILGAGASQEFLEELAFFKQELVRFQELLKA